MKHTTLLTDMLPPRLGNAEEMNKWANRALPPSGTFKKPGSDKVYEPRKGWVNKMIQVCLGVGRGGGVRVRSLKRSRAAIYFRAACRCVSACGRHVQSTPARPLSCSQVTPASPLVSRYRSWK